MTTPPALTERQLNRALLARQSLLSRADVTIPSALEGMGGLQAQYAPSMYIGLWSRVARLSRHSLTDLLERREVVQGTLLRSTIHLVTAADYWPWALAVRRARRDWYLRVARDRPGAADLARAADRLRVALAADGPMRAAEVEALVGTAYRLGIGLWIDLVRVPPSGTWERRRADLYAAAEDWLGPPSPGLTAEAGQELLVRRYLGAFGPASRADVATWAGLPARVLAPVFEGMALRDLRSEDGTKLVDL
ncbi:MAG: winged helix DNA-binding domain-containing protein, partial [Actinomycetota bacterium]|nr:winged helix DNA-binding domain-containing protein [Actinomycetota bacterium]